MEARGLWCIANTFVADEPHLHTAGNPGASKLWFIAASSSLRNCCQLPLPVVVALVASVVTNEIEVQSGPLLRVAVWLWVSTDKIQQPVFFCCAGCSVHQILLVIDIGIQLALIRDLVTPITTQFKSVLRRYIYNLEPTPRRTTPLS